MARILFFDPFNGVSGDMVLGALIDMGLPLAVLKGELAKLGLQEFELVADPIERRGLRGINFRVEITESSGGDRHQGRHPHPPPRRFAEIRHLIEHGHLDDWVKERSLAIFRRLGEAEAQAHGTTLESVHFHEVGAVDAIVDIVGACIGFHYFGIDAFYTAPLNLGGGTVTFSHGTWPVPAPATAELVRGFPVRLGTVEAELTTPTGAAIVTTLAEQVSSPPLASWDKWGFGAGDRELAGIPNMLRLMLGTSLERPQYADSRDMTGWDDEEIVVLEACIDDMDAQTAGYFLELALKEGALDVYYTPAHMKKNRPGLLLSVLCRFQDREHMAELLFRETTTLGLRWSRWNRWVLEREVREVLTEYGSVRVKIGRFRGRVVNVSPEYEDLRSLAERTSLPLKVLRHKVIQQIGNCQYE